jgi:hypothetical protein
MRFSEVYHGINDIYILAGGHERRYIILKLGNYVIIIKKKEKDKNGIYMEGLL